MIDLISSDRAGDTELSPQPPTASLMGRHIVVPESRQLDLFSEMLERRGATVLRCPLMTICGLDDPSGVDAWLQRLAGGHHDLLVFYTGEGITHLVARAEEIGMSAEVLNALSRLPKLVRGPKPAAALRRLGLRAEVVTDTPTTQGILSMVAEMAKGRCVGVQLYPGWPEKVLRDEFARIGSVLDPLVPYRYVEDRPSEEVAAVIRAMARGSIDLIAFTSQLQVDRLQKVALLMGLGAELDRAFEQTLIASVGPVTSKAVVSAGGKVAVQPGSSFHLKPFVANIVEVLGRP